MKELVCPNCGEENMVSVECVFQHYPVCMDDDGKLQFEGHVLRQWYNEGEPPSIQCMSCGYDTTQESIVEYMMRGVEEE